MNLIIKFGDEIFFYYSAYMHANLAVGGGGEIRGWKRLYGSVVLWCLCANLPGTAQPHPGKDGLCPKTDSNDNKF